MLGYLSKAFGQLSDPGTRKLFWISLAISIATFIALWVLSAFGVSWAAGWLASWLAGMGVTGWLQHAIEVLAALGVVGGIFFASFLLFPAVIAMVLSFLLDDVAAQVEARHYPGQPPAREQPLWEAGLDGLRLLAVTIGLNLLFLPVFLVLMFLPPLNLVFFYLLNGHLIGREYFELVAVRRMSSEEARALRKHYKARVFSAGVIIAILLTIPLVNLIMPLVATAFMVHVLEELRRRNGESRSRAAG